MSKLSKVKVTHFQVENENVICAMVMGPSSITDVASLGFPGHAY